MVCALLETNHLSEEQKQKLQWIKPYKLLIEELSNVDRLTNDIFAILKPNGLSKKTIEQCKKVLKDSKAPCFYKNHIKEYLQKYNPLIE